ncbi:hypothetical protein BC628DRAFT_643060 [Trametes gibbosa]|nr:hypothetical protein BC628DRAFT_643060 [Trametes gibbosa]
MGARRRPRPGTPHPSCRARPPRGRTPRHRRAHPRIGEDGEDGEGDDEDDDEDDGDDDARHPACVLGTPLPPPPLPRTFRPMWIRALAALPPLLAYRDFPRVRFQVLRQANLPRSCPIPPRQLLYSTVSSFGLSYTSFRTIHNPFLLVLSSCRPAPISSSSVLVSAPTLLSIVLSTRARVPIPLSPIAIPPVLMSITQ